MAATQDDDGLKLYRDLMAAGGGEPSVAASPEPVQQAASDDPGPDGARLYERLMRRAEPVGFGEAATTRSTGKPKQALDWVPYIATGREGIEWVDMFQAADRFNQGSHTPDDRRMLEDFIDWNARSRGFGAGVGGIVGDATVFMGEFATGASIAGAIGKKALKTAGGKALLEATKKLSQTSMAGAIQKRATTRTLGKLAQAGAQGTAIAAVNELPRAEWGRVMANARRLQFQRRFELSQDDAASLVVELGDMPSSLADVLPQAILNEAIEYGSEMAGGAIPIVGRLDALQDDIVSHFIGKVGLEKGRDIIRRVGFHGVWSEIGEEYLGAAVREGAAAVGGEEFAEFKGQLPETFGQTLEMYAGFGLMGSTRRGVGALAEKALGGRQRESLVEQYRQDAETAAAAGLDAPTEQDIQARVDREMEALGGAGEPGLVAGAEAEPEGAEQQEAAQALSEGELEQLEALTPEDVEAALTGESHEAQEPEAETVEKLDTEQAPPTPALPDAPPESAALEEGAPTLVDEPAVQAEEATPGAPAEAILEVDEGFDASLIAQAEGRPVTEYEEVPPETDEQRAAVDLAGQTGLRVRFVRGMEAGGFFAKPGEVVINADADPARELFWHEAAHSLAASDAESSWEGLWQQLQQVDPEGTAAAAESAVDVLGRAEVLEEEGFANYAQSLVGYMQMLGTPEGVRSMQRIARKDPGLWARIKQVVADLWRRVTGKEPETVEGESPRAEAARAAMMLREAIEGQVGAVDKRAEPRFAPAPGPVNSPEFKRWFGDSKVVDESGEPLVVYHGTDRPFSVFGGPYGGPFFFATDPDNWQANRGTRGWAHMPVYLRAEDPFDYREPEHVEALGVWLMDERGHDQFSAEGFTREVAKGSWDIIESDDVQAGIRALGHDGFWVDEGGLNIGVFSPAQIKSATGNRGTFDPDNPDIRFAPASPKKPDETDEVQAALTRGPKGKQEGVQLAKTSAEPELRKVQEAHDEVLEQSGFWASMPDAEFRQVQAQAKEAVIADPKRAAKRLLEKTRDGDTEWSAEDVFQLRYLTHSSAKLALNMEDTLAWKQVYALHMAYRQQGRDLSRAMRARQERFNEETTGEELMALVLANPGYLVSKKLRELEEERAKESTTEARRKEIDAEIDRILGTAAARNKRVYAALRKLGIDPATVTRYDFADAAQRARIIHAITGARATKTDKAREFLYASMLSGFATHARNTRGNLANIAVSKYLQDTVESAVNVFAKSEDAPTFRELRYMLPDLKGAGRAFLSAMRTQLPSDMLYAQTDSKWAEQVRGRAIQAKWFRPLRAISLDLLLAMDEAAKALVGPSIRAQYAHREGVKRGLSGEALDRYVEQTMADPAIEARAQEEMLELTFQNELEEGSMGEAVEQFGERVREVVDAKLPLPLVGTIMLPFLKTPLRLFIQGVRRSPLNPMMYALKAAQAPMAKGWPGGRRRFVRDTADAMIASAIFWGLLALLDFEDDEGLPIVTGSPSEDYSERQLQYRTGGPYTISLLGQRISYKQMDPIMFSVASTIDTARVWRNAIEKGDGTAATEAFTALTKSIGEGAKNASYLRTLGDLMRLAERGNQTTVEGAAFRTFVQPWVPNVIRHNLRAGDPYLRETRVRKFEDVAHPVLKRAPHSLLPSKSLAPPPKRDIWGRPIEKDSWPLGSSVWARAFPLLEQTASGGAPMKYDLMLLRLRDRIESGKVEAKWSPPSAHAYHFTQGGETRYWDDDEYDDFVRMSGERALVVLEGQKLDLEEPGERELSAVKAALSAGRRWAKAQLLRKRQQ